MTLLDYLFIYVLHAFVLLLLIFYDAPDPAPDRVSGEGVTFRDWDSLTFSFSELTPAFICTIYVITKFFLHIYIIHTTIVALIIFYTHKLESLYLYYYNFTITKLYI